jgi:hypothetical protein
MRHFAIDHETARARIGELLREYINTGTKMRFCCGKIPIPNCEDICCCHGGGWVHDAEKRVSHFFSSLRRLYMHGTGGVLQTRIVIQSLLPKSDLLPVSIPAWSF